MPGLAKKQAAVTKKNSIKMGFRQRKRGRIWLRLAEGVGDRMGGESGGFVVLYGHL